MPARLPSPLPHSPRAPKRWGLALCLLLLLSASGWARPKLHTVYEGQRLGSIAKRYNVTIEALCAANRIDRKATIKPGQKLVIPDPGWKPGDPLPEMDGAESKSKASKEKSSAKKSSSDSGEKPGKPKLHVVQKGHTLSAISGRYGITVGAICTANDLDRRASLDVGQTLVIPDKADQDGRYARKLRLEGRLDEPEGGGKGASWKAFEKPAWRRGYIKIRRYGRVWQGYVIGSKGEVLGHASNKINFVMGSREGGPEIDARLIRLIAQISDKFGGRELRIVSGYRTQSFVAASKHKEGRAIDFSIPGMPNEALRDYLRTIDNVGVGYYPNSSFVHLDVRSYNAYWVDYAGPGEAPQKSPHGEKRKGQPIESDDAPEDEDDSAPQPDHGAPDSAPAGDDASDAPSDSGAGDPSAEAAKKSAADTSAAED